MVTELCRDDTGPRQSTAVTPTYRNDRERCLRPLPSKACEACVGALRSSGDDLFGVVGDDAADGLTGWDQAIVFPHDLLQPWVWEGVGCVVVVAGHGFGGD